MFCCYIVQDLVFGGQAGEWLCTTITKSVVSIVAQCRAENKFAETKKLSSQQISPLDGIDLKIYQHRLLLNIYEYRFNHKQNAASCGLTSHLRIL